MRDVRVRQAVRGDAPGIAVVHVRAWQEAYRGLMPQDVLDGLSVEQRENGWDAILRDPRPNSLTLVAERDGSIVGWASIGAARFYERNGWIADGATKVEERPGLVLHERRHVKRFR
ncbi:hypothetical protein JRG78_11030 [Microbacterium sp. EF45047]|nr:hypothetical protein JSY13_11035 [Microbacterium neungamense]WCM56912.1 hypothetical protein JRG78_11030 [Microbacterium sp. EF45047]